MHLEDLSLLHHCIEVYLTSEIAKGFYYASTETLNTYNLLPLLSGSFTLMTTWFALSLEHV